MKVDRRAATAAITGGAAALAMLTGLAGCASNAPPPPLEPIYFAGAPIGLRAQEITLRVRPRPPQEGVTVVDQDFPVSIEEMARLWLNQRLKPAGGPYVARFVIDDATATRRPMANGEAVSAVLQARVLVLDSTGEIVRESGIEVTSSGVARGGMSPEQREAFLHSIVVDMSRQFDARMSAAVVNGLGDLAIR